MISNRLKAFIPFHVLQITAAKILSDPFRILSQPHNSTSVHGELLLLTSSTAKAVFHEFFLKSTTHYAPGVNCGWFPETAKPRTPMQSSDLWKDGNWTAPLKLG
jgi:hypothetical protein